MSVFRGSECRRLDKSLYLPRIRDVNRREFDVDSGVWFYSSVPFPDFSDLLVWGFYPHFLKRASLFRTVLEICLCIVEVFHLFI